MNTWEIIVTCLACAFVGLIAGAIIAASMHGARSNAIHRRLSRAFRPLSLASLTVSERQFPARIRADLQRALDDRFAGAATVLHHCGIRIENDMFGVDLSYLLTADATAWEVPLQNEELSIGDGGIVHCPHNALWIADQGGERFAVLLSKVFTMNEPPRVKVHVATANTELGRRIARELFAQLEEAVQRATSYRGKVLSLDASDSYSGATTGIKVHSIPPVQRDDVILPAETLGLVERNVLEFVARRPKLQSLGQSTRKGLLFHGPPGNGKTYTIRYLIGALEGHTTLLITGAELGRLPEYIALARLLQPSLVVIEDIDLVAKEKVHSGLSCEEPLLNLLLNEMDGLGSESEIIFVMTTNRPELLEEALAARPGRVDQAIEFGPPGDGERARLARLYVAGLAMSAEVVDELVRLTDGASAAFIKELVRRAVQCHLAHDNDALVDSRDVREALDELVLNRGPLNAKILGFSPTEDAHNGADGRLARDGCEPARFHNPAR